MCVIFHSWGNCWQKGNTTSIICWLFGCSKGDGVQIKTFCNTCHEPVPTKMGHESEKTFHYPEKSPGTDWHEEPAGAAEGGCKEVDPGWGGGGRGGGGAAIPLQEGGGGEEESVQQAAGAAGEHSGVLSLQKDHDHQLLSGEKWRPGGCGRPEGKQEEIPVWQGLFSEQHTGKDTPVSAHWSLSVQTHCVAWLNSFYMRKRPKSKSVRGRRKTVWQVKVSGISVQGEQSAWVK